MRNAPAVRILVVVRSFPFAVRSEVQRRSRIASTIPRSLGVSDCTAARGRNSGPDSKLRRPDVFRDRFGGGKVNSLRLHPPALEMKAKHNHEDKKEDVTFVIDVLDMWDFIETAFRKLPKKDKDRIAAEVAGPFGKHVEFFGFDAHSQNVESGLLHIAQFMVEKLGSFKSTFGGRDLDSHIPMAHQYRRMYRVFEPIRGSLVGTTLSTDQLIKILNAAKAEPGNQ